MDAITMCCSFCWLTDPVMFLSVNFRKSRRKTMHEMMFAVPINIFAQIWCKLLYFIIMQKLTSQPATKLSINPLTTQCMNIEHHIPLSCPPKLPLGISKGNSSVHA